MKVRLLLLGLLGPLALFLGRRPRHPVVGRPSARSLVEDVVPDENPVFMIETAERHHAIRMRQLIVILAFVMLVLMVAGLFVLILLNITGERLLVWQVITSALGTPLVVTIVAFFFSRPGGGPRAN